MKAAEEILFLRENLVLKGPFSENGNVRRKQISEKGSRQNPVIGVWVWCSRPELLPILTTALRCGV